MNCQNHPDIAATAYCRTCGKPVCDQCRRDAYGTVFCEEHMPASVSQAAQPVGAPMPAAGPRPGVYTRMNVSPGLALVLGFIPGVGAIYNGQYVKGLIHAVIFGLLVTLSSSSFGPEPLSGILVMVWIAYMVFEAYHTARKLRAGEPVDEYSSILNLQGRSSNAPLAGIVLVVLGVLLLLDTLNIFDFAYLARYWPVLLIAAGVYLLYARVGGSRAGR